MNHHSIPTAISKSRFGKPNKVDGVQGQILERYAVQIQISLLCPEVVEVVNEAAQVGVAPLKAT